MMHEGEFARAGEQPRNHGGGLGPLHRDQRPVVGAGQCGEPARRSLNEGEVALLRPGIDDDVEPALTARRNRPADHQVIDNAALVVEQEGVADLTGLQGRDIAADQRLYHRRYRAMIGLAITRGRVQGQEGRPHMRDVEDAGVLAGPEVLFQHPVAVLDRHLVAAELDQPRAGRDVGLVQGCALQRLGQDRLRQACTAGDSRLWSRPRCPST